MSLVSPLSVACLTGVYAERSRTGGTMPRYTFACDDATAQEIQGLAVRYGLTEQEVLEQLVDVGLEQVD